MWDATRVAIDIDLDQPVILGVTVSVHVCSTCSRMFRGAAALSATARGLHATCRTESHRRRVSRRAGPRGAWRINWRETSGSSPTKSWLACGAVYFGESARPFRLKMATHFDSAELALKDSAGRVVGSG
jgi:hypothetical protein